MCGKNNFIGFLRLNNSKCCGNIKKWVFFKKRKIDILGSSSFFEEGFTTKILDMVLKCFDVSKE